MTSMTHLRVFASLPLFHDTESNQPLPSQLHIWTLRDEKGAGTETLMVEAVMLLLCPWPLPFLARYRPRVRPLFR